MRTGWRSRVFDEDEEDIDLAATEGSMIEIGGGCGKRRSEMRKRERWRSRAVNSIMSKSNPNIYVYFESEIPCPG